MTWLGWLGSIWLVLCGVVVGSLWFFREQKPDPLRTPEYDDEMGYRRKLQRLATDALGGDDAEIVKPMGVRKPKFTKHRVIRCPEMNDPDRTAPWETPDIGDDAGVDLY